MLFAAGDDSGADRPGGPKRPNILWITSEDNGPYLGCYRDRFARTPNLDRLAAEGVTYLNAVANAPARSTLITGCYASALGTHPMRSRNEIPESVRLYPERLQQAGYWCTNHKKTDYNLASWPRKMWDKGKDWTAR